eukprot:PhM_4_TR15730/c0_g1_i1/m.32215/K11290/SET, TAF1, I2PP2A; template-activating factor I
MWKTKPYLSYTVFVLVLLLLVCVVAYGADAAVPSSSNVVEAALHDAHEAQNAIGKTFDWYRATLHRERSDAMKAIQHEYVLRGKVLRAVPRFWLLALTGHPRSDQFLTTADVTVLRALEDVQIVPQHDDFAESHLRFNFTFAESNPYFEERSVWRDIPFMSESVPSLVTWKGTHGSDHYILMRFLDGTLGDEGLEGMIAFILSRELWHDPVRFYLAAPTGLNAEL